MIFLDGNIFYADVKYNDNNNTISLVKGYGWTYNGKTDWKSVNKRWKDETKQWVGSNYFCYMCIKIIKDNLLDISLMKNYMFLTQKIQFYLITLL